MLTDAPPSLQAAIIEVAPDHSAPQPPPREPLAADFRVPMPRPQPVFAPADEPPPDSGLTSRYTDEPVPSTQGDPRPVLSSTPLTWSARRPTDDFYPAASLRMGEQGATLLRVCVTAQGTLQAEPQVTQGSGYARLDAAAVTWARDALAFRPATVDGAAVAACKAFRVTFTLRR